MSLEQQLSQLPKPLLAVLVITGAVLLFFFLQPPHTICDTEKETIQASLSGLIYPQKIKKNTMPARLTEVMRSCESGRSAGSCYEYFNLLRSVAKKVNEASAQCRPDIYGIKEVKKTLNDGIQNMALLAWGHKPPESPTYRFGWLQESELSTFCLLKDVYTKVYGEEGWAQFRAGVYKMYPGSEGKPGDQLADEQVPKAIEKMTEAEIWQRSVFSVRCEGLL